MRVLFSILMLAMFSGFSAGAQADEGRLKVVYASAAAEQAVVVSGPMFRPVGNFMMMNVKAQNVLSAPVQLEYKVEWYDEQGFPLKGVSGWQTLFLSPNQEEDVRVAGQKQGAYSARITVR